MPNTTMLERLDFLSRELEMPVEEVLTKAIEAGIGALYRHRMGDKFVAGQISRDQAMQLLGPREVARIECLIRHQCDLADDEIELICGHA